MAEAYCKSYYAATANAVEPFGRLEQDLDVDVAIIGGGFTGVNTAIELAQRGLSVILLEARRIGWGASGRNAGFNTLPASKLSAKAVFQRWPEAEARASARQLAAMASRSIVSNAVDMGWVFSGQASGVKGKSGGRGAWAKIAGFGRCQWGGLRTGWQQDCEGI